MKFSVIIPVHNAKDRIKIALRSILMQTYKDFEIILILDDCTDNSRAECGRCLFKETRYKIIETDYGNDGLARSRGLDEAQGEWVLFMDDDDCWVHPYVLEGIAKKLAQIGEDNVDVLAMAFYWNKYLGYCHPYTPEGHWWVNVWSKAWKRSFIGETRFPNIHSISDFKFCEAVYNKNPQIVAWDTLIYFYNYMREGSITETDSRKEKEHEHDND